MLDEDGVISSAGVVQERKQSKTHNNDEAEATLANEGGTREQKDSFPEGGAQAWACTFGSVCAIFCTFGYVNAFGIFQEYYYLHQLRGHSHSAISWIGSIQIFFLFGGGAIGGPLFDKYGATVMWPPSVGLIVAVMLTSLCKEYYQFILAQGVLGGFCVGVVFVPAITVVSHYFRRRLGLAMGIVVGGSSIGGVIWPILLHNLLNRSRIGFGWAVRICAFIMLALLVTASLTIKPRLMAQKKSFNGASFLRPVYIFTVLGVFSMTLGMYLPYFYLPSFSIQRGMSPDLAFYTISILNGSSFFGRVFPGILSDKLGRFNILFTAAISSGILLFCWQSIYTNIAIFIFTALYGFFSGAIVSLMSACIGQITPRPEELGAHLGLMMGCTSIAGLIGPPIDGAFVARYGGYSEVGCFAGACLLLGGAFILAARLMADARIISVF